MALDPQDIFEEMLSAGAGAFGEGWTEVKEYAETQFEQVAVGLARIAEKVALHQVDPSKGFNVATGRMLFDMQKANVAQIIAGATTLLLKAVQDAINAILEVIKTTFEELRDIIL